MGCSKSKEAVQTISVESAKDKLQETLKNIEITRGSSTSSGMGSSASTSSLPGSRNSASSETRPKDNREFDNDDEDETHTQQEVEVGLGELPNTLDEIPVSDLGESLDAGRMKSLWSRTANDVMASTSNCLYSSKWGRHDISKFSSAFSSSSRSEESGDSGIYDLDDDYAFVITEHSSPDKVRLVLEQFTPVEHLDLTINGKACPRLLSGSQKARQQEQQILESLREEGFISSSKQRAGGGLAFEIVEATPETESAGSKIKPKDFLPRGHKEHLDAQRNKHHLQNLTSADLQRRQFLAEERRRLEMEAKVVKVASQNHSNQAESKVEELKKKKEDKDTAALENREAHLRDLRDKLKAQNKKAQQIKLKKLINAPPVPVPVPLGVHKGYDNDNDDFFLS